MNDKMRPTKKQRELLDFIAQFIASNGYGPSYREIMQGCGYSSVATVALHVNNLIAKGHLRKKDKSARALELTQPDDSKPLITNQVKPSEEKWLIDKVNYRFTQAESAQTPASSDIDELQVLVGALKVLGLDGAARVFASRLGNLKEATK
jgi:SOS-response transcriptional repressor LexA